jgi:hypothetical protein
LWTISSPKTMKTKQEYFEGKVILQVFFATGRAEGIAD